MAEGQYEREWWHTASIIAALINANPFRSGPAVTPEQLHPNHAGQSGSGDGVTVTKEDLQNGTLAKALGQKQINIGEMKRLAAEKKHQAERPQMST